MNFQTKNLRWLISELRGILHVYKCDLEQDIIFILLVTVFILERNHEFVLAFVKIGYVDWKFEILSLDCLLKNYEAGYISILKYFESLPSSLQIGSMVFEQSVSRKT